MEVSVLKFLSEDSGKALSSLSISKRLRIKLKGAFNIEILNLLSFHRVYKEGLCHGKILNSLKISPKSSL